MISIIERFHPQGTESSTILSISILICTYNPDEQIFQRVLKSVEALILPDDIPVECVIVDNNSSQPVDQLSYVRNFLMICPWAKVIQETRQGLAFARIAGLKAARNSLVIFIDDDNEVAPSYLNSAISLFSKYPSVAAWGPGNIEVEFIAEVSTWFSNEFNSTFQGRNIKYNEYGCVPEKWTSFYPFGTGLAVRREVLDKYYAEFQSGNLSALGRKGKSLSSGEDIQIVWEAIKMGYAAGISPSLVIKHLIPSSRSNLDYVRRLTFNGASSYLPCLVSSFPEAEAEIVGSEPSSISILKVLLKKTIKYSTKLKFSLLLIDLADYLGGLSGYYQVIQKNNPLLDFMVKQLKLR